MPRPPPLTKKGAWVSESFSPFPFVASGEDDFDASSLNAPNENRESNVRRLLDPRGFDALVDKHFASIERVADQRARERALLNATKKADKVKKDQERRANDLRREERLQETRATLIEYNLDKVNAVIAAVNSLLASGQSWDDIERFVEDEKRQGNPVAGLVKSLDLKNNAVTVALTNRLDDVLPDEDVSLLETSSDAANASPGGDLDSSESSRKKREKKPSVAVTLDLSLSAYANAREHFDKKKRHAAKLTKTENQSGRALESARRDSDARVKKSQTQKKIGVGSVSLARTPEWFEKFHWFITPENCLVLSARDASQTNLLLKKYMGPHDAFVRADVAKAPATIVKAPYSAVLRHYEEKEEEKEGKNDSGTQTKKCLVPSLSLAHAGAACLCRSAAWDTRTVISAWWVPSGAVRVVAENGDALAPGVVWHVGRKRYLPPAPLVMGYAYAFLVKSEDDVTRHAADRTTRVLEETDDRFHEEEDGEETFSEPEENNKGPRRLSEETRRPASSALDAFLDGSVETTRARAPVAEERAEEHAARCDRDGEEADKAEEAPEAIEKNSARGGKARVSAAERRAMKKAMKKGAVLNGTDSNSNSIDGVSHELDRVRPGRPQKDDELEPKPKQKPPKNAAANKNASDKKQKPLPRGKSAKARRAAARYAEQDDEDRALAMALLGVKMKDDSKARTDDDDDDDDDETNAVSRTSAQSDDDAATTTEATTFTTRAKGDNVDDEKTEAAYPTPTPTPQKTPQKTAKRPSRSSSATSRASLASTGSRARLFLRLK
jgi:predicted ribosome quality control (RQC) complex YloA/Tae2 family protein